MSSKKKNKSKKNKSAPKDFDALKIPENNGDVEALITATNAGDIQWDVNGTRFSHLCRMCTESPGLSITAATGPSLCASVARSRLGAGTGGRSVVRHGPSSR